MGRYLAAIPPLKQRLAAYPNDVIARLNLMVAYEELERDQDARAEAAEVMRLTPQFSLLLLEQTIAVKDLSYAKRFRADCRKAGLK